MEEATSIEKAKSLPRWDKILGEGLNQNCEIRIDGYYVTMIKILQDMKAVEENKAVNLSQLSKNRKKKTIKRLFQIAHNIGDFIQYTDKWQEASRGFSTDNVEVRK